VKKLRIYVDTSVIGGCEDEEFSVASRRLWSKFATGEHILIISELTLQEIEAAPPAVREHLEEVPAAHQVQVELDAELRYAHPKRCCMKKKTFDAVAFMRKRREELSRAYAGLSAEQIHERIQQSLKDSPWWKKPPRRNATKEGT